MQPQTDFAHETLQKMIKQYDVNQNGQLEFDEFVMLLNSFYDEQYWRVFWHHDKDKSGSIDRSELADALLDLGLDISRNDIVEHLLAKYDDDASGELQYMEFLSLRKN